MIHDVEMLLIINQRLKQQYLLINKSIILIMIVSIFTKLKRWKEKIEKNYDTNYTFIISYVLLF